jgi:hypothetical protein
MAACPSVTVQKGADPAFEDGNGRTCARIAEQMQRRDIAEALRHVSAVVGSPSSPTHRYNRQQLMQENNLTVTTSQTSAGAAAPSEAAHLVNGNCSERQAETRIFTQVDTTLEVGHASSRPSPQHWAVVVGDTMLTDIAARVLIFPNK